MAKPHLVQCMTKKPNTLCQAAVSLSWRALVFSITALCSLAASVPNTYASTIPQQIIDATQAFLEQATAEYLQRSAIQGRHEVQVTQLDSRLRLAECDTPLTTSLESPAQPIGRVTVRVQCEGDKPWTIFMPAQVKLYRSVILVSRPLQRQAIIEPSDIYMAERDTGTLTLGYLTDPEQVIGKALLRNAMPDQPITPQQLQEPLVVHRGEQVTITALRANISVRMPGEALSDGMLNQQIRVKNLGSGRVITGRVTAPGQVEVNM